MDQTTVAGLSKPIGTESMTRPLINNNMDTIDKQFVVLAVCAAYFGTLTKGAMTFDAQGRPSSQSISGPNGLAGTVSWTYATNTITETLSITAPSAFSFIKTFHTTDLSETWSLGFGSG